MRPCTSIFEKFVVYYFAVTRQIEFWLYKSHQFSIQPCHYASRHPHHAHQHVRPRLNNSDVPPPPQVQISNFFFEKNLHNWAKIRKNITYNLFLTQRHKCFRNLYPDFHNFFSQTKILWISILGIFKKEPSSQNSFLYEIYDGINRLLFGLILAFLIW